MRKILFIVLALVSFNLFGQVNNVLLGLNNELFGDDKVLLSVNTLEYGLILSLKASSISEDSLTYNSTGNLVTNINGVNVDLDDDSEVVIGNSVRFGTPTSGTIYQVVDTGSSALNLVLDQTFTGSVTDEYYCGGVNTWRDESGKGNDLYQSTATRQPKLLWYNTDSVKVVFDGVNDYIRASLYSVLDIGVNNYSIAFKGKIIDQDASKGIITKGGTGRDGYGIVSDGSSNVIRNDLYASSVSLTSLSIDYTETKFVISNNRNNTATISTNLNSVNRDISTSSSSLSNTSYFTIGAAYNGGLNSNVEFDYIYIYLRTLTDKEIQILSE